MDISGPSILSTNRVDVDGCSDEIATSSSHILQIHGSFVYLGLFSITCSEVGNVFIKVDFNGAVQVAKNFGIGG